MSKSCLSLAEQNPVLLDKKHYLATLMVIDVHKHVLHNGVKGTLTQLWSVYWLVRGRQFVWRLIHSCVICRKGKHCRGIPPPPLPEFHVVQSQSFQTIRVDFAGPLYVRSSNTKGTARVWLCLYMCCATRAVHLDLVPDMTATGFLRNFKSFTACRRVRSRMISDNAKSAATTLHSMLANPEVKKYFSQFHIDCKFNLEKAP